MKKLFAVILSLSLIITPVPVVAKSPLLSMLPQLIGLANGIIGSSVLAKCSLGSTQFSVMTYMLGSVVHILGEIDAHKMKKSDLEDLSESYNANSETAENGQNQKTLIEAQLKNEQSNLRFAKRKMRWTGVTLTAYLVSVGLAIVESSMQIVGKPSAAACKLNSYSNEMGIKAISYAYSAVASSGGEVTPGKMAIGVGLNIAKEKLKVVLEDATKIGEPIAIPLLNTAESRIIFFTTMSVIVGIILAELNAEKNKIKKQIKEIEEVLARIDDTEDASGGLGEGGSGGGGREEIKPNTKNSKIKPIAKSQKTRTCLGQNDISAQACSKPRQLARPKFDADFKIPELKNAAHQLADLGQMLANGNSGAKAEVEAGSLAAKAGRIRKINNELLKKVNERLVASGKKPIDIDAEVNKQMAAMNSAFGSMNPGGPGMSMADAKQAGEATLGDSSKDDSELPVITSVPSIAVPAAGGGGIDFSGIGEEEAPTTIPEENTASLSDSLSEFESSVSDISKDTGVSIFKQVSNRYLLNYTKIFEKNKIDPPMRPGPDKP